MKPRAESSRRRAILVVASLVVSACLLTVGCHSRSGLPATSSKAYSQFVSAFYVGLSALQVGADVQADANLKRATELAPGEPAAWADWGILALRERNFTPAAERFARARKLAPKNAQIYYLLGLMDSAQGESQPAITNYRKAVRLNPQDLRASYALAQEIERQNAPGSQAEFQKLIEQILAARPDNLAALLELSRIAAKRGDAATLHATIARIAAQSGGWPAGVKQQLTQLQAAASGPNLGMAALRSVFLHNVLMQVPAFRSDLSEILPSQNDAAQPFTQFLRLPSPSPTPSPADTAIRFTQQPVPGISGNGWSWIGPISLDGQGAPAVVVANGRTVKLSTGAEFPFPGGPKAVAPTPEGVTPLDFNYDFKTDLALAGAGGVRLMEQNSPTKFTDVTAATKLPPSVLHAAYTGSWAADVDEDGDLDIVMGQASGLPTVLRNNGDGTFTAIHPFAGVSGLQQFVWADFSGDGTPDAAFIDGSGRLHLFINERAGRFTEQKLPSEFSQVKAIAAGDVNRDGLMALVAVLPDGTIARISSTDGGQSWTTANIAAVPNPAVNLAGPVRLRIADVDNNGAVDLILAQVAPSTGRAHGALIWLANSSGKFSLLDHPVGPSQAFDLADVNDDGRLALLGLSTDGQAVEALNHGTKDYHWQILRPRARQVTGDQRVNSFGIGGQISIRSGLLTETMPINGPQVHFGLGDRTQTNVARIFWPNGTVSAEFALKANEEVLTEQRLKGSCPFLFAWNGKTMNFVADTVPWGAAIGLKIDGIGTAKVAGTDEWFKIPGRDLAPRNGFYDLRITGELWETYYYDHLALMVVDHPNGTAVFTNESYTVPAVKPTLIVTATPQPIVRAVGNNGEDVTATLRNLDGSYLHDFKLGQYQGVATYHHVDIDLGPNIPASGPLYLIAKGWLHPSDSTVVEAMSQGNHPKPQPVSLSIKDAQGHWQVVEPNLGFPEGRNKICVYNLTGLFHPGQPHWVRLSTNLEIYWDQIEWAKGMPNAPLHIMRLPPSYANLHYRGYSAVHQAHPWTPEIPDYNRLMSTTQIWRDLSGYYTRYGDVRPLLKKTDDQYVIMNAGDEISMRFPAQAAPQSGWTRDYFILGDGWVKDGDFNTAYSKTNRPLPYHARTNYDSPPGPLADEYVVKHFPKTWETYQTRYVTPHNFETELRSTANP